MRPGFEMLSSSRYATHCLRRPKLRQVLWIRKYFFRILESVILNYGSGSYLDISVAILKKVVFFFLNIFKILINCKDPELSSEEDS